MSQLVPDGGCLEKPDVQVAHCGRLGKAGSRTGRSSGFSKGGKLVGQAHTGDAMRLRHKFCGGLQWSSIPDHPVMSTARQNMHSTWGEPKRLCSCFLRKPPDELPMALGASGSACVFPTFAWKRMAVPGCFMVSGYGCKGLFVNMLVGVRECPRGE